MPRHAVMIIAKEKFRDEELFHTKEELEHAGIAVTTASTSKGTCTGKLGGQVTAQLALGDIESSDFDAIVFVGGPGVHALFENPIALDLARTFSASHKTTAAICSAPAILANAGVLKGKKATSFPDEQKILQKHGATVETNPVVVDGHIVTAEGPVFAHAFGIEVARAILAQPHIQTPSHSPKNAVPPKSHP